MKKLLYKLAINLIIKTLRSGTRLTPKHLLDAGWICENDRYREPSIKDRDRVTIVFIDHYYRVWHSEKGTFIALETTREWLELYMILIKGSNLNNPHNPLQAND